MYENEDKLQWSAIFFEMCKQTCYIEIYAFFHRLLAKVREFRCYFINTMKKNHGITVSSQMFNSDLRCVCSGHELSR